MTPRNRELLGESGIFLQVLGVNLLLALLPATGTAAAIGIPRARAVVRALGELSNAARTLTRGWSREP